MNRRLCSLARGVLLGAVSVSSTACAGRDVAITVSRDADLNVVDAGQDAARCDLPPDLGIPDQGCPRPADANP
ncbi:MAG: hypothetical protein H6725_06315 [Sandaracinaceae bacterium]|nr:hypothetical protein [Sandaracinaceae bacterium]